MRCAGARLEGLTARQEARPRAGVTAWAGLVAVNRPRAHTTLRPVPLTVQPCAAVMRALRDDLLTHYK
jgi:hypothetical protein